MRIYDGRLGRFLSVDPLTKSFAWYSPYQFAGNTPIAAIDLEGGEQKIMINWRDATGNVTKTKMVKFDFTNTNSLYQSLSAGLNTTTTYDLEGTKFNSTNAIFTSGFDAYKTGTTNPRGNQNKIRPNNGILNFDICKSGTVLINYDNAPINEKELAIDALRGVSEMAGFVGDRIEELGYVVCAIPGLQKVALSLIVSGKAIGLAGDLGDLATDYLEGKTDVANVKTSVVIFEAVVGGVVSKIPKMKELTKQVIDSYIGRGGGAIRDGYGDSKTPAVEESNVLDLKIETKK